MILDKLLRFSTAQAVTALGDTPSTDVVDTGKGDAGAGEEMFLFHKIDTSIASAGAATIQFVLQSSADNATFTDEQASPALAIADATAGKVIKHRLPVGLKRYVRVAYRVGTAALTAGAFTSLITKDVPVEAFYASGFSIK
jgi:hypothetical protein